MPVLLEQNSENDRTRTGVISVDSGVPCLSATSSVRSVGIGPTLFLVGNEMPCHQATNAHTGREDRTRLFCLEGRCLCQSASPANSSGRIRTCGQAPIARVGIGPTCSCL